ncbi:MAG: araC 2 [Akkermansiaceae bacterium]|nr:araC 2 [Akkermansiaceae bacterium]
MKTAALTTQSFRYLPLYPEIDDWGARVLSAGRIQSPPGAPYPAPGHPDDHHFEWSTGRRLGAFAVVYITAGKGIYESETSGISPVEAGDLFVIFPGVWHRYRPDPETGWTEYWVESEGNLMETAIAKTRLQPAEPVVHVGHDDTLMSYLSEIIATIHAEPPGFQALIGLQSVMVVARLRSLRLDQLESRHLTGEKMVRQAILAMSKGLHLRMNWEDFSGKLGVSYSSFRRTFRGVTGRSPADYFTEMRMNRAKQLLAAPSKSIQEVSAILGFDTSSHFSHLFKTRTGLSPRAFRASLK